MSILSVEAARLLVILWGALAVLLVLFVLALLIVLSLTETSVGCPPWMGERNSRIQVQDLNEKDVAWLESCGFKEEAP
jgi:hypothetical protein